MVKELVRFMLYRLEHHEHGVELYNCCFEPAYTIQYIVEAMKKVTGLTQFVPDIPNWVIMPMARAAMFLGSQMGICPARVKKLQISTNICGEKLKNCGYQFKWSFEEALADWFEDNDRKYLKQEMIKTSAIFLFLNYCLGKKVNMSMVVAKIDWRQLYTFASRQALLGFCFDGIERLTKEFSEELKQNPMGRDLLMTWMGAAQQIRRQNVKVNAVAGKLYSKFREDGLRCCILKGQGNALMYPNPYSRTPGDIDVWVNASREQITEYAKKHFMIGDDIRYHHLETTLDGVPVELHFFPGIMNNPIYNARLQKWFKRNADLQCSNVV